VPKGLPFAICIVMFPLENGVVFPRVNLYSFHSHAANNTWKSNVSHEKTMLAILVPSIASLCFLISLSAYLWFKKRAKKGNTRLSINLYLLCRPKSCIYPALVVGRSSLLLHDWKNNKVLSCR